MKYARYEATRPSNTEKTSAAESKMLHPKASPVKDPIPIKSQCPPASVTTVLPSLNNDSRATHNKENSASKNFERTLDERFEDSGYMSLHNSQIDDWHGSEEDDHVHGKSQFLAYAAHQEQIISPNNSPSKCQGKPYYGRPVSLVAASTPVDRPRRKTAASSFSSTPSDNHRNPNLPILNFQRAVCEELEKGYRRNKRYDWSIVTKLAEDHLLDRVIGGHMGLEYVDMFTSLLSRNMRSILTNILTLLGDLDLISCKKVSRTWKKIICEDTLALRRCTKAEEALWESRSSQTQKGCGLTRDAAVSRVVLSCMQNLASSSTQSSLSTSTSSSSSASTPGCKVQRRTSQKGGAPISRLSEYVQVASSLKQHESLRQCKLCGSPATHLAKAQRATCTRSSCLFDFCTRCQEAFHGSTPCRTVQPRSSKATTILPGSAHSKRNIRRL
ncbi:F-box only protein 5 [Channa argus]|uniref:F-box only protein 5 n=1 Tax=Channa argus TaxID=215402 RepID=A0A6G1R0P0_CHAAH|nr:F-box only protein 5 [Channa argus]